jgi:hypothetical protein
VLQARLYKQMRMKKAKSTLCVLLKGFDASQLKEAGVKRRQSFDESGKLPS